MTTTELDKRSTFLKNEITAFENRLETIKIEISSLQRQKDALTKTMQDARDSFNADTESRHQAHQKLVQELADSVKKFEKDKEDFRILLMNFKKDQVDLQREKQDAADTKANYQKMAERVSRFIAVVNRESPLL